MRWNSVMIRIWLPFLAAALMLLYFLAVHIPSIQRETLLRFQNEKLGAIAGTIKGVLEYAQATEQLMVIPEVLGEVPSMEMVDRVGILYTSNDHLEILYQFDYDVEDGEAKLQSLLREDVTVEDLAKVCSWSGGQPSTIDGFFKDDKLAGVTPDEFVSLMDPMLLETIVMEYPDSDSGKGIVLVLGNRTIFDEELASLREPFILIQTLLALGAIALFYYLAFHVSRPILGVASVAEEMRQGNLDVEIQEVGSLNEMGVLTSALRELRDELKVKRRENKELTEDMERKIVERTEQLEEALSAKDEFLSTMSHEIRTPLHSLIAIGEMLRREDDREQKEELLKSLNTSSKQLLALINDILDFSKISAGKLELHEEAVPLRAFFEELAQPFEVAGKDGVEFVKSWPDKLDNHVVQVDAMRLSQILHNLLSNAFKFTEQGEVILGIRCKEIQKGGQDFIGLEVQIVDTGVGIAEENVDAILAAFTQENSSISRKFGGTGLGLSIVNRLLHMMGSELEVESTLGQGSMFGFYIELPLTTMATTSDEITLPLETHSLEGLRLLYVEDMEPNRFVMKAMVRPWGINLTMADSGQEALEVIDGQSFDLILMDIQMPEMDGVETLRQIMALHGDAWSTPVVAFTAHAQDKDVTHYKSQGFLDVLTKPAGPDTLKSFLNQFVVNK